MHQAGPRQACSWWELAARMPLLGVQLQQHLSGCIVSACLPCLENTHRIHLPARHGCSAASAQDMNVDNVTRRACCMPYQDLTVDVLSSRSQATMMSWLIHGQNGF